MEMICQWSPIRLSRVPDQLQRNQPYLLQLIEHRDGAEGPEEDAAQDEGQLHEEARPKGAREQDAVNNQRVPAAKAEGEVVAERGPFDELIGLVEPQSDDAEDAVADEDAEINVADVFWRDAAEARTGGPKDIDPTADDSVSGGHEAGGED